MAAGIFGITYLLLTVAVLFRSIQSAFQHNFEVTLLSLALLVSMVANYSAVRDRMLAFLGLA